MHWWGLLHSSQNVWFPIINCCWCEWKTQNINCNTIAYTHIGHGTCSCLLMHSDLLLLPVVEAQDFNCTFSGHVGKKIVCYCSVQNCVIHWWDDNATFCSITMLNNSMDRIELDEAWYLVEGVNGSIHPTGAFTSKLTLNVSTELNDTEIGCASSHLNSYRPSNSDQKRFRLPWHIIGY